MGTMAAAGGVVGLGVYGLYKIINGADAASNFSRNMQALAEITREYEDKSRWAALEVDAELEALKSQMATGTSPTNEIDAELQALKTRLPKRQKVMAENSAESVLFIAGGATAGAGVSATVGGMGLAGGFGAVGIGMAPVTVAGAVVGAAAYGAFRAIAQGDSAAFGAIGIGALGGAGVSATVGGMGLAGGFGAVGIGMGSMAAAGGVVGLGLYGIAKLIDQAGHGETAAQAFDRMEDKILWQDAYTEALMELDPVLAEVAWKQKFAALEVEEELKALKAKLPTKSNFKTDAVSSSYSNQTFTPPVNPGNPVTNPETRESQFTAVEIEAEILAIQAQPPQTWKCLQVLKGHTASVNCIAISSDGQTLASGSQDRTVSLWNLKTGKRTFTFFGQAGEVHTVAISPDSQMLVAGGFDNKITSWQLNTKALLRTFFYQNSPYSHSGFVSSLAFSRDRKILASASGDKTIRLWGGYTGEIKRTLNGHSDTVWSVAISSNGQTLVSGSADKTIRLWSLSSSEQPRILSGHSNWVTSVAITPDGNTLTSSSTDGTIKLWNLHNGELLRTIDTQSTGIFSIAISPDGKTLATGSIKEVQLWNLRTGELLYTLSGRSPVAFSPDGQTLVSAAEGGRIKIWCQILNGDESTLHPLLSGEWWEVLGVGMDAAPKAVKLAYRQLARQYHPDVNRSASAIAKMQAINKAYEEFLKEFSKAWL
jgi:WD40 repeat protein